METQITLPSDLKQKIEREATAQGMTVDEFVTDSLERAVANGRSNDPLFADDAVFRDDGPTDTAANHDEYLYGDAS